jgi:hypothetical protein
MFIIDDTWHEIIPFINHEDLPTLSLVNKLLYSYTEQHTLNRAKNMTCPEIVKHFNPKVLDAIVTENPEIPVYDALVQAVKNRSLKQVQLILQKCKNLDINYRSSKETFAPVKSRKPSLRKILVYSDDALTAALRIDHIEIIKLLVKHPDIVVEKSGIMLFCQSTECFSFELAKHLLSIYCTSDTEKASTLEQAIANNNDQLVKYMLHELKYDMTWIPENYLWLALSRSENAELFQIALSDSRLDPTTYLYTILMGCMSKCNIETAKVLLKYPIIDISYNHFQILSACSNSHLKEFLKDSRVNPSANSNKYVLQSFDFNGSLERAKLFVRHSGFDPTIMKTQLLLKAAQYKYEELAVLVLSTPGEYDLNNIWSVLESVIQTRNISILKRIVKDERIPLKGALPLACYVGDLEMVQLLLGVSGGRVEADEENNSPIIDACRGKQLDIIQWLLLNYPDAIDPSCQKNIVFTTVVEYGRIDILQTLLQQHTKLQLDNTSLAKALRVSCKKQYTEIIQLLLEKTNVDPTELDYEAFKIAKKYNSTLHIIQMLSTHNNVNPDHVEKALLKSPMTH